MSDPDYSKHWDSITEDMGLESAAEPPERPQPAPATERPADREQRRAAHKPADRTPTDWTRLAEGLGVKPSATADSSAGTSANPSLDKPAAAERPRGKDEVPSPSSSVPATPAGPARAEPSPVGLEGLPTAEPMPVKEDEIDFGESEARSTDEEEDRGGRPRRRRRKPRRRTARKRAPAGDDAAPAAAPAEADTPVPSATADDRDRVEAQADAKPVAAAEVAAEKTTVRSSHRSIPAWEEAVGVIVDANIEARASRGKSGRSSRSRGRGRKR